MDKNLGMGAVKGFGFQGYDCSEQGYHRRNDGIGTDTFSMEAVD